MDVKLIDIDASDRPSDNNADYTVRLVLELDGARERHEVSVQPGAIPAAAAGLIVPSHALGDRLRLEQYALHRICRLVSKQLHGSPVRLPRQVAA